MTGVAVLNLSNFLVISGGIFFTAAAETCDVLASGTIGNLRLSISALVSNEAFLIVSALPNHSSLYTFATVIFPPFFKSSCSLFNLVSIPNVPGIAAVVDSLPVEVDTYALPPVNACSTVSAVTEAPVASNPRFKPNAI